MSIKIEFSNEEYPLVVADIIQFLESNGFHVTTHMPEQDDTGTGEPETEAPKDEEKEKPKRGKAKKEPEPEKEPDPEPEPADNAKGQSEPDGATAKSMAIDILMKMYNDGKTSAVKELLTEFDVKKFGELPDERGHDLLKRANEMDDAA